MTSPAPQSGPPQLGERLVAGVGDPPVRHVRAALDTRLRAMLAHERGTRDGADPEDLHQMRVAVRRMRAVLRAARPLLDRRWADRLRAELGWLGRALGPVRDLDVLIERLSTEAAALGDEDATAVAPLLAELSSQRERARAALLRALDGERYAALLRRLAAAVAEPLPPAPPDGPPPELSSLVAREVQRLRAAAHLAGDEPPDGVLHALRIQGKRLRYVTELAEPTLGASARDLLRAAVALQDVLGEHQDACVAQHRIRALLATGGDAVAPRTAFAAGRLVEREETRRLTGRAAWPAAWRAVDTAATALDRVTPPGDPPVDAAR